jgi:AcrR family transcriptional regulator
MPRTGKGGRYHHGDLSAALIETAVELIGERGVRNFSMAEASRRLGVAVSAPYAHFAGRDELLAAVTVHAFELMAAELPGISELPEPADRLAAMTRAYVRFAAAQRPLFEVIYQAGLDKARYPQIQAAVRPVDEFFLACVTALAGAGASAGDQATQDHAADDLASAIEATAHGHAMLLLDGGFGQGPEAVTMAAERAARATLALVASRHLLRPPAAGAAGTATAGAARD